MDHISDAIVGNGYGIVVRRRGIRRARALRPTVLHPIDDGKPVGLRNGRHTEGHSSRGVRAADAHGDAAAGFVGNLRAIDARCVAARADRALASGEGQAPRDHGLVIGMREPKGGRKFLGVLVAIHASIFLEKPAHAPFERRRGGAASFRRERGWPRIVQDPRIEKHVHREFVADARRQVELGTQQDSLQ
jgi:hypothetical protein